MQCLVPSADRGLRADGNELKLTCGLLGFDARGANQHTEDNEPRGAGHRSRDVCDN